MGRAPCCDKANVKKGPWSPEEDSKLKEYIDKYGTGGNWIALPQKAGLKRCGKSCRLRWLNYLRPNIKHGEFSEEEDRIICTLFTSIGSRWSIIAAQLPGRTDNDIKNYWNTKLKKKLRDMQYSMAPPPLPTFQRISKPPPPLFPVHQFQNQSFHDISHHHNQQQQQPLSLMHKDLNLMNNYSYTPTLTTSPTTINGSLSSSGFEMTNNIISTSLNNYVNSPSLFQTQEGLVGSMPYNNHHHPSAVKKNNPNLIMFGSTEGSCTTSSDGSCNNNNQIKQEELGMGFQFEDHHDDNHHKFMLSYGNSSNYVNGSNQQWGSEGPNEYDDNTLLGDYDNLEDIKRLLISSSNGSNVIINNNGLSTSTSIISNTLFSVDEKKTDLHKDKVVYFY